MASTKRDRDIDDDAAAVATTGRSSAPKRSRECPLVTRESLTSMSRAFWASSASLKDIESAVAALDEDAMNVYIVELGRSLARASWGRFGQDRKDVMSGSQCYAMLQYIITTSNSPANSSAQANSQANFAQRLRWVLQNAMILEALIWHQSWDRLDEASSKSVPEAMRIDVIRRFLAGEGWTVRDDAVVTFACIVSAMIHERFRPGSPGFLSIPTVEHK